MTVVRQRTKGDCACAALSMVAGESYEDTYVEIAVIDPKWRGKRGLYNRELIAAAARLGITLHPTRLFDLETDRGVLRVRPRSPRSPVHEYGHFVALADGAISCPQQAVSLSWAEYCERFDARPATLLKEIA